MDDAMEEGNIFYKSISEATPMMSQYLTAKAECPDCLLLFRLGDFYECFFDDAKLASSILNIVLTKRGKAEGDDEPAQPSVCAQMRDRTGAYCHEQKAARVKARLA